MTEQYALLIWKDGFGWIANSIHNTKEAAYKTAQLKGYDNFIIMVV